MSAHSDQERALDDGVKRPHDVEFYSGLIAILDDQPMNLPADYPYYPDLQAVINAIHNR